MNARAKILGGDEIAFVGAEFDKTAALVNELLEARALLIRNLLHKLKTTVTTAKLTAALIAKLHNGEFGYRYEEGSNIFFYV